MFVIVEYEYWGFCLFFGQLADGEETFTEYDKFQRIPNPTFKLNLCSS